MPRLITALRPVAMGATVILEGQPYLPADDSEEKELLASKRWRPATKEDAEAWKTRLSADPALAARLLAEEIAADPFAGLDPKARKKAEAEAKAKADADAAAKADADAKAKAEAEEKEKQEAEAKAKVEADSKAGPSTGPVGIG